jgi:hypothetical protein
VIVVADTGPLISLAVIDRLDLLGVIFGKVVIPEAVWGELARQITIFNLFPLTVRSWQLPVHPVAIPLSFMLNPPLQQIQKKYGKRLVLNGGWGNTGPAGIPGANEAVVRQ